MLCLLHICLRDRRPLTFVIFPSYIFFFTFIFPVFGYFFTFSLSLSSPNPLSPNLSYTYYFYIYLSLSHMCTFIYIPRAGLYSSLGVSKRITRLSFFFHRRRRPCIHTTTIILHIIYSCASYYTYTRTHTQTNTHTHKHMLIHDTHICTTTIMYYYCTIYSFYGKHPRHIILHEIIYTSFTSHICDVDTSPNSQTKNKKKTGPFDAYTPFVRHDRSNAFVYTLKKITPAESILYSPYEFLIRTRTFKPIRRRQYFFIFDNINNALCFNRRLLYKIIPSNYNSYF